MTTTSKAPIRTVCVWCVPNHELGIKCGCGVMLQSIQGNVYACPSCLWLGELRDDAPVTSTLCELAAIEARLAELVAEDKKQLAELDALKNVIPQAGDIVLVELQGLAIFAGIVAAAAAVAWIARAL